MEVESQNTARLDVLNVETPTDAWIRIDDQLLWGHDNCGLQPGKLAQQACAQAHRTSKQAHLKDVKPAVNTRPIPFQKVYSPAHRRRRRRVYMLFNLQEYITCRCW